MKTSIFQRILIATLIPAVLIFSLIITFIYGVSTQSSKANTENIVENFTHYAAETIYNTLRNYEVELQFLSRFLPGIIMKDSEPENAITKILAELIEADMSLNSAWVVFEPGFISEETMIKSIVRRGGKLSMDDAFTEDILNDPVLAEWYHLPVKEGKVYFDPLDLYDDGVTNSLDTRPFYNCDISFPIWNNGEVVGAVGFDFLYSSLFSAIDSIQTEMQTEIILIADDMTIMYCSYDKESQGKNFLTLAAECNGSEKVSEIETAFIRKDFFSTDFFSFVLDEESLFCIVPVSINRADSTMYLYTVTPTRVLYKASDDLTATILYTSIAGILILMICVFFASNRIAVPIKKLTETSNKIAEGNLDIDFGTVDYGNIKVKNELIQLKISLEAMVVQLKQAHETDMKRIEAELEKERVQASSDAKSVFFANMSHEIRTPMNSILGITQIMLHEDNLSEKQRKYINDIRVSSDSLLGIINDILDLSKLESGKMSLAPIDYNFKQFIDNICSLGVFLTEQKKLDFRYFIMGELPVCLFGDDTRLRQVIVNIISNAVKFTQQGFVSFNVIVKESVICFEIKDTGIGIKPENIPCLFHAYEQIRDKKTSGNVGTGLGLSICKNLVDVMGGEISVESEYGKGSTFRVVIPKVNGDVKNLTDNMEQDGKVYFSSETKILIVDDNEINLHVANGLIETLFGIDCDLAQSGSEALSLIAGTDYDIVFMDHMMPEMDGVETTQRIRGTGKNDLIIVALTANAVVGTKALLIGAGMNDFLSKPIDKNELENILLKWLPKERRMHKKADAIKHKNKPEYSSVISQAEKIVGLDISIGLNNVAYNQEVYEKSLSILSSKIPDTLKLLPKLCDEGNFKDFSIHVHGMKSSLASVGAMSLSKQALKLERASKDNDGNFCREALPVFINRLGNFGEQLEKIFGNTVSVKEKEPASKEEFYLLAENFNAFVSEYNYESAMMMMQKLENSDFGDELNAHVDKVKHLFEAFDYESIKTYLAGVFNKEK